MEWLWLQNYLHADINDEVCSKIKKSGLVVCIRKGEA